MTNDAAERERIEAIQWLHWARRLLDALPQDGAWDQAAEEAMARGECGIRPDTDALAAAEQRGFEAGRAVGRLAGRDDMLRVIRSAAGQQRDLGSNDPRLNCEVCAFGDAFEPHAHTANILDRIYRENGLSEVDLSTIADALAAAEQRGFEAGRAVGWSEEYADMLATAPADVVEQAVAIRITVAEVEAFQRGRDQVLAVVRDESARVAALYANNPIQYLRGRHYQCTAILRECGEATP